MKRVLVLAMAAIMEIFGQNTKLSLPAVFSDNMILQQNSDVNLWGRAVPGNEVLVKGSWTGEVKVKADSDGNWRAELSAAAAGGPYSLMIVSGKEKLMRTNILFGEVWVCSGQSNMEMPMQGWPPSDTVFGGAQEIAGANYPQIRLFTVGRNFSLKCESDCQGKWLECSPENVAGFSATAFFFGKKLHSELKVPIGLIHSSWGGTPAQAWTGAAYLDKYPNYKKTIDGFDKLAIQAEKMDAWLKSKKSLSVTNITDAHRWQNLDFDDAVCSRTDFDDSAWKDMDLPSLWENAGLPDFDGVVWFRKTIMLPEEFRNKELTLQLGPIDDMDAAYVNGTKVGGTEEDGKWQEARKYMISREINNSSTLTIACRVIDPQGGGGIYGKPESMMLTAAGSSEKQLNIAGKWKYLPVAEYRNQIFYYWGVNPEVFEKRPAAPSSFSASTPAVLFNAMIAPLIPYTIRGVIWYQGEANAELPDEYSSLFPDMVASWRKAWRIGDFPFYFTQIAPFDYGESIHSELLRDAQLKASRIIKNSGMAVTMDIGNPKNIHPGNKKEVGARLAAVALAKTYKLKVPYSGPVFKTLKIEGGKAILSFDFADGLRVTRRNNKTNFQIAGGDGIFYDAEVVVNGRRLIISSAAVIKPVTVRYCWSNTMEATLFNQNGLPASSFSTTSAPVKKKN